ncbi:unnamed protein product, partial [Ectocarpus fasciculatus]
TCIPTSQLTSKQRRTGREEITRACPPRSKTDDRTRYRYRRRDHERTWTDPLPVWRRLPQERLLVRSSCRAINRCRRRRRWRRQQLRCDAQWQQWCKRSTGRGCRRRRRRRRRCETWDGAWRDDA